MTEDVKRNVQDQTAQRRKLFLGGLSTLLETDHLIQYFKKYGIVEDAIVMRHSDTGNSKGFGFVTFTTVQETEECLQDGPHVLFDKRIDMKRATPREEIQMSPDQEDLQKRKLFIGSVHYATTTEKLEEYFSQFGKIEDCVVMKHPGNGESRGFGFVTYSQVEEVDECQSKRPHVLDGRRLDTKRATSKHDKAVNENSIKRLFVGRLDSDKITDEALNEYFSKFGAVVAVEFEKYKNSSEKFGKKRDFAFVEFYDYDAVDKVLRISDHSINGEQINVAKALPKEPFGRWGRGALGGGNYSSPWSTGIVETGFGGMGYVGGNGLYNRIANEMYRSNLDSNMIDRLIEEKLRGSTFGGLERSRWMDVKSRQAGLGRYGGGGPSRNQMRGFRRGPY